jgi:hypothetical protein
MEPALATDPLMIIYSELLNSGIVYLAALFHIPFFLGPDRDGGI